MTRAWGPISRRSCAARHATLAGSRCAAHFPGAAAHGRAASCSSIRWGSALLRAGQGIDVRPHPHIGLATVTYLFKGMIVHRDSLGSAAADPARRRQLDDGGPRHRAFRAPGCATPAEGGRSLRPAAWVALPQKDEETDPHFVHHARDTLPVIEGEGVTARVIAGAALRPHRAGQNTLRFVLRRSHLRHRRAALSWARTTKSARLTVLVGTVEVDGAVFEPGRMLVLQARLRHRLLTAPYAPARVVVLGGAPMDGRAPYLVELRLLAAKSASSRPRRIGRRTASASKCRAKPNSFRCRTSSLSRHIVEPLHRALTRGVARARTGLTACGYNVKYRWSAYFILRNHAGCRRTTGPRCREARASAAPSGCFAF